MPKRLRGSEARRLGGPGQTKGASGIKGDVLAGMGGGFNESAFLADGFPGAVPGGVDAGLHLRGGEEVRGAADATARSAGGFP